MTDLFDYSPPAVGRNDPDTSHAAAAAIAPVTGKIRQEVYAYAVERGPDGFIDDELEEAFPDAAYSSYRKRRGELVEAGRIVDTGKRRPNPRGRQCVVWAVAA